MIAPSRTDLERAVTRRSRSFFVRDVEDRVRDLKSAAEGRRVLVVGGGGSIGAATTRALLALSPASVDVHLVKRELDAEALAPLVAPTAVEASA